MFVLNINEETVRFVIRALVIVEFVLNKFEIVDCDDTSKLLEEIVDTESVEAVIAPLTVKFPFKLTLPFVAVKYACDINSVFLLAGRPNADIISISPIDINAEISGLQPIVHQAPVGDDLVVQRIPSLDVIILFVPSNADAINIDNSGDQITLCQLLSCGVARVVQVIPSLLDITRCPTVVLLTATNK